MRERGWCHGRCWLGCDRGLDEGSFPESGSGYHQSAPLEVLGGQYQNLDKCSSINWTIFGYLMVLKNSHSCSNLLIGSLCSLWGAISCCVVGSKRVSQHRGDHHILLCILFHKIQYQGSHPLKVGRFWIHSASESFQSRKRRAHSDFYSIWHTLKHIVRAINCLCTCAEACNIITLLARLHAM